MHLPILVPEAIRVPSGDHATASNGAGVATMGEKTLPSRWHPRPVP